MPTFWRNLVGGLRRLLRRSTADRELDDEVRHYLEMATDEYRKAGLDPARAARAARVEVGSVEAVKERVRGSGWESVVDATWRDLLYGIRMLRRSPGFAAVAVVVLAIGIGVNTAMFSIINAVLLRDMPVKAPRELAFIYSGDPERRPMAATYGDYQEIAGNTGLFSGVAASRWDDANLRLGPDIERLVGEQVSGNYFDVLGISPKLGRGFQPAVDEVSGASLVVVISDALWRRRFNAASNAIGQTLPLGYSYSAEQPRLYTVVGIMGPAFMGVSVVSPWTSTDYWVPIVQRASDSLATRRPAQLPVEVVFGRMRPGVAREQVQAFATVWGRAIDSADGPAGMNRSYDRVVLNSRRALLPFDRTVAPSRLGAGLMIVASLVLLISVTNLAGIVVARGVVRRSEVAIRLTLGASRWRLARQLATEGLLLAALGGAGGIITSRWLLAILLDHLSLGFAGSSNMGRQVSLGVPIDGHVIVFTMLVCAGVGLVVGLAPVRQASNRDLVSTLSGATLATPRQVRSRLRYWILVPQVCVSLALLLAAGVAVRSLLKVALVEPGYEPDAAVYASFDMPSALRAPDAERDKIRIRRDASVRRLLEMTEASPAVEAAALASVLPTGGPIGSRTSGVTTRERFPAVSQSPVANMAEVTASYFQVLGIPVKQGRGIDAHDGPNTPKVAVINELVASRLWPGESPIGHYLAYTSGSSTGPRGQVANQKPPDWLEVVGVVGAVTSPLSEGAAKPFVYTPLTQASGGLGYPMIVARGRGTTAQTVDLIRGEVARLDGEVGMIQARTIGAAVDEMRYPRRLAAGLLGFSGLVGLLLASVGLYGVVSYSVVQRLKELSIRAALGADRRDITMLVMKEGARAAAVGAAFGLVLAFIGIRILSNQVMPIPALDLTTVLGAPALLGVVILAACYIPARRASRVDPMDVLRGL